MSGVCNPKSADMSLLFSSMYKCEESDLRKKLEFMGSNFHHQQQQQQQQSSGLMRYRSAPSSLIESLVDGSSGGSEEFRYLRSSSPEVDAILEKWDSDLHEFGGKLMKQEATEPVEGHNGYSNSCHELQHQNLGSAVEAEMGTGNCSNLVRQSSSPAGLFSNFNAQNVTGYAEMRGMGNYKAETAALNSYMDFSNGSSSSNTVVGAENGNKRSYMSRFSDNSGFDSLKRAREDNASVYLGFSSLSHQYSLPNTYAIDKLLQFQGSVPCKIRAKRGFATHPRSIAERMRRTRISDRMKKLQELFPDMDKQANTADMLDLAVDYIKDLQKRVSTLKDTRDKCTCSTKTKQYSNP